jgi:hypothetical protein
MHPFTILKHAAPKPRDVKLSLDCIADGLQAMTWAEDDENAEDDKSPKRKSGDNQKDKQEDALSSRKVPKAWWFLHCESAASD